MTIPQPAYGGTQLRASRQLRWECCSPRRFAEHGSADRGPADRGPADRGQRAPLPSASRATPYFHP